jgi:hypothetical protein
MARLPKAPSLRIEDITSGAQSVLLSIASTHTSVACLVCGHKSAGAQSLPAYRDEAAMGWTLHLPFLARPALSMPRTDCPR